MSLRHAFDLARHLGSAWFARGEAADAAARADPADPGAADSVRTRPDAPPVAEGVRALTPRVGDRPQPASPYRGFVESADPQRGIGGWLVDLRDPFARPELELVVAERVVARCAATRHRCDVWLSDDPTITPGFVFGPEIFHLVNANLGDEADRIEIRIAGSGLALASEHPLPDRARIAAWLAEESPDDRLFATTGLPLGIALARHLAVARGRGPRALRALESDCVGFVEAIFPIDSDDLFVSGWTQRPVRREQSAVLVADGRKHPAALIHVDHPRDDLASGALAFFGILRCAWRPASSLDTFFLFLHGEDDAWLRAHRPLALRSREESRERLQLLQASSGDARLQDFLARHGDRDPWLPTPSAGTDNGLFVGIDTVRLLPGFGALVDGWCLSARSTLASAELRVGGAVLKMDPASRRTRSRHDLASGFPRLADRLGDAGIAAVFRGALTAEHGGAVQLRLTFADGSVLATPIDAQVVRRVDPRLELSTLAALHPGIEAERWLPDFAAALHAQAQADAARAVQVLRPAFAEDVVIRMLPEGHELSLVLDELVAHASLLPPAKALILVVTPRHPRETIQRWGEKLRQLLGSSRVGITTIAEPGTAFWMLPEIARRAGARRFSFVGADLMLTRAGWQVAASLIDSAEAAPRFLVVETLRHGRVAAAHDHQAFQWHTEAFASWLETAPFLPSHHAGTHGMPGAHAVDRAASLHARQLLQRPGGALNARVHDALLRRHALASLHEARADSAGAAS